MQQSMLSRKHPEWKIVPEIMIPLVGEVKELAVRKDRLLPSTADELIAQIRYANCTTK